MSTHAKDKLLKHRTVELSSHTACSCMYVCSCVHHVHTCVVPHPLMRQVLLSIRQWIMQLAEHEGWLEWPGVQDNADDDEFLKTRSVIIRIRNYVHQLDTRRPRNNGGVISNMKVHSPHENVFENVKFFVARLHTWLKCLKMGGDGYLLKAHRCEDVVARCRMSTKNCRQRRRQRIFQKLSPSSRPRFPQSFSLGTAAGSWSSSAKEISCHRSPDFLM